jgi:hypothetical protein
VAALSDSEFVVAYQDYDGTSNSGNAVVGQVSDMDIAFGTEETFTSYSTTRNSLAALSPTRFVVVYEDWANFSRGTAVIGDVAGPEITFGSETVFGADILVSTSAVTLSASRFVVAFAEGSAPTEGAAVVGEVSGSTISFGSRYPFDTSDTCYPSAAALSATKFVAAYADNDSADTAVVVGYAVDDNAVGVASESAVAGQTVPVIIGGVSDVHSGLVPGEMYYNDVWVGWTTEETNWRVGLAISPTELILRLGSRRLASDGDWEWVW